MTLLMALTRWAHLLPLMAIFGASAFLLLLRQNKPAIEHASRFWLIAAVASLISAFTQFILVTISIAGVADLSSLSTVLQHTRFGEIFAVRAAALVALTQLSIAWRTNLIVMAILSALLSSL